MKKKLMKNIIISIFVANVILLLVYLSKDIDSLLIHYTLTFFISPIVFEQTDISFIIFLNLYYIILGTIITFIRSKKMMISFLLLIILIHIALEIYLIHKFSHFLS